MGNLTEHFDSSEFKCPCCGEMETKLTFVKRLERLRKKLNAKSIVVSSGYRCPKHSLAVGGYSNDAHVLGFAADIAAFKQDGTPYSSKTIAKYAEQLGFGGIGLIDPVYCHVDTRDENKYANNHWFGNEATGQNYTTFQDMTTDEIQQNEPGTVEIIVDGETVYKGTPKEIKLKTSKE